MVKLKRMLGDIDDPTVVVLMALIESQSAETLANELRGTKFIKYLSR